MSRLTAAAVMLTCAASCSSGAPGPTTPSASAGSNANSGAAGNNSSPHTGSGNGGAAGTSAPFKCPAGSDAVAPVLPADAGAPVANVPPTGYDPDNLEGPVWIGDRLYLSEIAKRESQTEPQGGRIIVYQPGVGASVFLQDVGTNGLAVADDGHLVAASHKVGGIVAFALTGAAPSPTPTKVYAGAFEGTRFSSPNDLALRSDGNVYFTDPSYQAGSVRQAAERAYRVAPGGEVTVIPGADAQPNGVALSPDQNTLYVGGGRLLRYPVSADGSLGAGADFPSSGALSGTDGLGVDCAGNLYVALYNEGTIAVLRPDGSRLGAISVGRGVTNVAFGGADGKTLFITRMLPPSLYAVQMNVAGLPY